MMKEMEWDVFIVHASEDKDSFVRPLAHALSQEGIKVWFDEHSLFIGDSIRRGIEDGLRSSTFGVIIISPDFLNKEWPQKELDYFISSETDFGQRILPVYHNVTPDDIRDKIPLLADRLATTSAKGLKDVVLNLVNAIKLKRRISVNSKINPTKFNKIDLTSENLSQQLYDYLINPVEHNGLSNPKTWNQLENKNILFVDDDPNLNDALQKITKDIGLASEISANGYEALIKLDRHFDVVISDLRMPGISGEELCERVTLKHTNTSVILMSGFLNGTEPHLKNLAHAAFIVKPFEINELFKVIYEVLQEKGLYQFVKTNFPDGACVYRILYHTRKIIKEFLQHYQTNDLFEVAIRHKIKDTIREFCNNAQKHIGNSSELANQMSLKVQRLNEMMDQIHHNSSSSLDKILKGLKQDIESKRKLIFVSLSKMPKFTSETISKDLETFLAFCALEFTDNAQASIKNKGQINITFRKVITRNALQLSVWDDGPIIKPELAEHVFEEGVTTKGPGRGIGLYIIKNLCDRFGGDVHLNQDEGVQFSVIVPF
jgi:CheY-like chemotaxis protein